MPAARDKSGLSDISPEPAVAEGRIAIAGREYVTPEVLADLLGITTRTLARWSAARIGPPKIKLGKTVLIELSKLPGWLASRETAPVRLAGRPR